jgi:hypothetical protein
VSLFSHVAVDTGGREPQNKHVERVTRELPSPADQAFSVRLEDLHLRRLSGQRCDGDSVEEVFGRRGERP